MGTSVFAEDGYQMIFFFRSILCYPQYEYEEDTFLVAGFQKDHFSFKESYEELVM